MAKGRFTSEQMDLITKLRGEGWEATQIYDVHFKGVPTGFFTLNDVKEAFRGAAWLLKERGQPQVIADTEPKGKRRYVRRERL